MKAKNKLNESRVYNVIGDVLQGVDQKQAEEYLHGFDFSECEVEPQKIGNAKYIDEYNGIEMYYDYAGDYYFFVSMDNSDVLGGRNINLKNSTDLEALKESFNKVLDKRISEQRLSEKLDSLKSLSFGECKSLFESVIDELYDAPEGKKLIGSYVKLIKENKSIHTVYKILEGVSTLDKENADTAAYVLCNMCESVDRKQLTEGEKKMQNIVSEALKLPKNVTCESIDATLENSKPLNESIARLTHKKNVNINEKVSAVKTLTKCITESTSKSNNTVNEKTSGELKDDLSNLISEAGHDAWENQVIKDLTLCSISNGSKETLFETYKNDCISTIDEISDDDNKSRLFAMKQQLSEKKYNEETLIEDLFNLAELKKTLLEA